ncbi:M48 family metallopeptidase [Thermocoleostomius sinensis]|jgi:predicted Zn-dependent protease|uniref:M48 family metallopeptidase n=1 Tax=Thermocoleostomius sinensis A174 TaxID=2016057 RepID=A0A9E9C6T2_9CYAN|nr:M48 family metallopeptidase [Thermocoleostomius sinensis]WAL59599.1 M48 family metallopeptidase [Thermocoleostomius sinensis A174]
MARLLIRFVLALIFVVIGLFNYATNVSENPVTGERQRVQLTPEQEIVLGQQARAEMAAQFGGLYPDETVQDYIDRVGQIVVQDSIASESPYPFEFHVLNDPQTINAFALPGGQIFITVALLSRLTTEAQLAGVLGHEVGHVVARHGSEHLARQQLGRALVNAIVIAASDDPNSSQQASILAQAVNQLVNLRYGRADELESDRLGFQFMTEAEYTPIGIVELMQILNSAQQGGRPPEFLSTHPNPRNRVERLEALIAETYPNGVPPELREGELEFAQEVQPRLP